MVPATTPKKKPAATRATVANVWACSSPVEARSRKVLKITDGGGSSRPLESPRSTTISQPTASVTGTTSPSVGQARRDSRLLSAFAGAACSVPVSPVAAVMDTRDITSSRNATGGEARSPDGAKRNPGAAEQAAPPFPGIAPLYPGYRRLVRHHISTVDQLIERLLDVDARADHTRLLQRNAGLKDRLPLRRADLVVDEAGALLELLVDHVLAQLGHSDEDLPELVVVRERVLARLLVGRDHSLDQVRMIFDELLARVEDAPGVGVGVAIEQPSAVDDLMLRHHRVEPG